MIQAIIKSKPTRLFLILGGFFIANALIAEIIGVKIFSLEKTLGISPLDIHILGNEPYRRCFIMAGSFHHDGYY